MNPVIATLPASRYARTSREWIGAPARPADAPTLADALRRGAGSWRRPGALGPQALPAMPGRQSKVMGWAGSVDCEVVHVSRRDAGMPASCREWTCHPPVSSAIKRELNHVRAAFDQARRAAG